MNHGSAHGVVHVGSMFANTPGNVEKSSWATVAIPSAASSRQLFFFNWLQPPPLGFRTQSFQTRQGLLTSLQLHPGCQHQGSAARALLPPVPGQLPSRSAPAPEGSSQIISPAPSGGRGGGAHRSRNSFAGLKQPVRCPSTTRNELCSVRSPWGKALVPCVALGGEGTWQWPHISPLLSSGTESLTTGPKRRCVTSNIMTLSSMRDLHSM